jgi:protein-tyrosine phosphatase
MRKNLGLVPIKNFSWIYGNIWRSAQPRTKFEYKWLEEVVGIDFIINLRAEKEEDWRFTNTILNIPVKDHHPPTVKQATDFIKTVRILSGHKRKILIHCLHGHGRTSDFSVLSKLANWWTLEDAIEDEKKRFHINFNHKMQEEFLRKNFK